MRSCKRKRRSRQNSNRSGTTRKPDQKGGRGTAPMANLAAYLATARSSSKRRDNTFDCFEAQAPIWASRGREAK